MLITRLRLPPFIVTLGTLNIFFALVLTSPGASPSPASGWIHCCCHGQQRDHPGTRVTYGTLAMLAMYGVMAFVLRTTAWGTAHLRHR